MINRPLTVDVNIAELKDESNVEESMLDSALVSHPSIIRAQSQISAAEKRISYSRKNKKPNIGIGLDYAFVSERTDIDVADNGKDIFMPLGVAELTDFQQEK